MSQDANAEPQGDEGTSDGAPQTGGGDPQATVAELQQQLAAERTARQEAEATAKGWQANATYLKQVGGPDAVQAIRDQFKNPDDFKAAVEQYRQYSGLEPIFRAVQAHGSDTIVDWVKEFEDVSPGDKTVPQPQPTQPQNPSEQPLTREELMSLLEDRDRQRQFSETKSAVAQQVAIDLRGGDEPDPVLTRIALAQMDEAIAHDTGGQREPTEEEVAIAGRKVAEMLKPLVGGAQQPDTPPTPAAPDNPTPPETDQTRPGAGEPPKRPEDMTLDELHQAVNAHTKERLGDRAVAIADGDAGGDDAYFA